MAVQKIVILPPQYLPTPEWFAAIADADLAVVDVQMRHDKRRKSVHRAEVQGQHGPFMLTVPVSHTTQQSESEAKCQRTWADINVSEHGHWWTVHIGAIESAYGRTPYFEHYWPLLRNLISSDATGQSITLYDSIIESILRQILGLATPVSATMPAGMDEKAGIEIVDLRRHDFSGESVLSTIFNHGPNAMDCIKQKFSDFANV